MCHAAWNLWEGVQTVSHSLVHCVGEVLAESHALQEHGILLFGSSMDECLDSAAVPSACRHVWVSFLFHQETPKEATWEHGLTFNGDKAILDFLHQDFRVLCEVESHVFCHINTLDSMSLCCHMAHEVLHNTITVGAHPMRTMGQHLLHGVATRMMAKAI